MTKNNDYWKLARDFYILVLYVSGVGILIWQVIDPNITRAMIGIVFFITGKFLISQK